MKGERIEIVVRDEILRVGINYETADAVSELVRKRLRDCRWIEIADKLWSDRTPSEKQPGQTCEDRKFSTDRVILDWTCPDCRKRVEAPVSDIATVGAGFCQECDEDMALGSIATVIPGEEADKRASRTSSVDGRFECHDDGERFIPTKETNDDR